MDLPLVERSCERNLFLGVVGPRETRVSYRSGEESPVNHPVKVSDKETPDSLDGLVRVSVLSV